MTQNSHHFIPVTVFTPAQMAVHIFCPETQGLCSGKGVVQAPPNRDTVGRSLHGLFPDAWDPQTFLQAGKKLGFLVKNMLIQFHIVPPEELPKKLIL